MGAPWCCGRAVASTPPRVLLRCRHTSSRSDRGRSETANPPDRVRQVRQQGVSVAKSRGFSHSSRGNGQICNFSYRGWGPAGRQRQQRLLGSTDWAPTQAGRSTPRELIHGRFNPTFRPRLRRADHEHAHDFMLHRLLRPKRL